MGKRKSQLSDCSDDETKSTKKKTPKKNNERKFVKDSELEEGEVTDSDSSDLSPQEFDDGYGSDLMGDDDDRLRLARMTEKEREQEIFRRVEARETMKIRFNIEKKLRKEQRRELKKQRALFDEKIGSPSTVDAREHVLDKKKSTEEIRSKSGKKSSFSNASKARREDLREFDEKENRPTEEQSSLAKKDSTLEDTSVMSRIYKTKLKASDVYSDDSDSFSDEEIVNKPQSKRKILSPSNSSSSDSESDYDSRVRRNDVKEVQYISTRAQLNQIKLSRHKLERFLRLPFFKRTAVGCFVKVLIAANKNRSVYKVGEIVDICETDDSYQVGDVRTNKILRLKHGAQERNFRLQFVSNAQFLDEEFVKWQDTCTLQGVKMPTVERMESKMKGIKEAMLFELTVEEIEKLINEKERFKNSRFDFAVKRAQLLKEFDSAKTTGDSSRAAELQNELDELEERAAKLDHFRASTISSINYINDRNRKRNMKEKDKDVLIEQKQAKEENVDHSFAMKRTTRDSIAGKVKNLIPTEYEELVESSEVNDAGVVSPASNDWTDEEDSSAVAKMSNQKPDYGTSSRSLPRNFS